MKDIRPQFTEEEYHTLRSEADRLGISLKQLVHNRALGIASENTPLCSAKLLCAEMAAHRKVLNQIILRETEADERLLEDDIIRLEMSMTELEGIVTGFTTEVLRQAKRNGDIAI